MIKRRKLIALLGGAAAYPFAALAQQADRMHRIGVLGTRSESAEDLRQALYELGWREGQNIAIEWRWAAGRLDQLPAIAAELVGLRLDLGNSIVNSDKTSAAYWWNGTRGLT
jgi:putative tryptophan/tyrosine transport system substrate-binding protein